jgi:hypothetical protein
MRQSFVLTRFGRLVAVILVAGLSHLAARVAAEYLWFRTSDLFGETMFLVRSSSEVARQIGSPVITGWPVLERYVSSKVGEVTARVPIRGPRGEATLQLRAKNRGGSWEFQQLEAQVVAGKAIDLMPHPWRPQRLALRGSGQLYFVGIGPLSRLDVNELARSYSERYKVDITVLPSLPYGERSQWAKEMIRVLKTGFPELVADPQAVIIAVTEIDMEWYSWRADERFAIVSASGLSMDRFRKQLSKCLGLLWFELPMSADSRSVLYDTVESVVDLDLMSGDF